MPIEFTAQHSSECIFSEWKLSSGREKVVAAIAYLYLQQEKNAQRVIDDLDTVTVQPKGKIVANIEKKLTAAKIEDVARLLDPDPEVRKTAQNKIDSDTWARDGLLFQHISWIAVRVQMPGAHMTPPHVRQSDKGFDGFIIDIDPANNTLRRLVLCEDKASHKPRNLITQSVWAEIRDIVGGGRDDQIIAGITNLVRAIPEIDEEEFINEIFWGDEREFRVSVATGEDIRKNGLFSHLMEGFEEAAGGEHSSRVGAVLAFPEVRSGLQSLADDVIQKVKEIAHV
ncbi:hypothetical protein B5K05_13210 [Rhizobium phaseoli]|uniref:hypothetical protein n=1 Tax=Rhizobium phaseoli TaxID=396 RepID=UPI000E0D2E29|nr:hypothetical protein [Rhizobium phaseoli]RDJ10088.1 hypothetical protein B5K04_13185 [Rhizobium phaseoli]RDJ14088.1 hypothetical protein B5K05_13210 [Rhizobium phaseoli]